ncbi:MAG TPA: peptidoglycan-binding protein LysM [Campylobacterales bacterium]|nr:peptidoglycan-binding protein LysM [Campylobacterales bacterium]
MGFFDFVKDAGKKMLGLGDDNENIKGYIAENSKTMPIENLEVIVDGETVTIKGHAKNAEDRAKAALIAGNIEGVAKVIFDDVTIEDDSITLQDLYYEIQKGDTLWKVADIYYKDGSRYPEIVEANLEVIKDADKIYPGQMIRIPNFVA